MLQGYGLTESSPVISFNRKTNYKLDTVGQVIPGVEVKIAQHGEIWVRGYNVMRGYFEDREESEKAITHDGWLRKVDAHLSRISWDRTWAAMRREINRLLAQAPRRTPAVIAAGEEARV